MKLTIITDHRFYRYNESVYDDYVFDYDFFKTYLKVFDELQIVARVKNVDDINKNWNRADGDNITFIDIPDTHGLKWLFSSSKFFKAKQEIIFDCDALCFRIPSQAAWEVFKLNKKKLPYMFESIGDPQDAMLASGQNPIKKMMFTSLGKVLNKRKKIIVSNAQTGSYVSLAHLQKKFPVAPNVHTESISSIRLRHESILDKAKNFNLDKLRLIHVGSFIPLKNQKDLVHCVKKLVDREVDVILDLVGNGALKTECMDLAKKLGVSDRIVFHGQVTGFKNITDLLDNASVFVLPSSNEGMPRSLIEAMARGLVCFGSNVGGISELLDKDFTFSPGNINQMADMLFDFVRNSKKEDYEKISAQNIDFAKKFEFAELESRRINVLKELKNFIA